jgi:hypothetical protein
MRTRSQVLLLSTILAAGLSLAFTAQGQNVIKDQPAKVGSGLSPQGGQINPGAAVQAPAGSPPGKNDQSAQGDKVGDRAPDVRETAATSEPIPSPKEARQALLGPVFKDPLPGDGPVVSAPQPKQSDAKKVTGQGAPSPTDASNGQAAVGGAMSPGASGSASSGGSSSGGSGSSGNGNQASGNSAAGGGNSSNLPETNSGDTVGSGGSPQQQSAAAQPSTPQPRGNGGDEPRLGPIGAIGQTMPAKFSKRNDTLDRLPTMAWPLAISDQERQQLYQTVMSDKSGSIDVSKLRPADQVPPEIALNNMHPLPDTLAKIGDLDQLAYVKGKDKVLLVTPATRIVVDVISNQS